MSQPCEVLIVGSGPTGLVLALWLAKLGVKARIIDKTAEPGTTSRALAVQARTLELYRQLGLADAVVRRGVEVPAVNLWVKGEQRARLGFEIVGKDLTPYAFLQIFPQDQHERLLLERLAELGVCVERRTELLGYKDEGNRITARLRGPDGQEEVCEAAYIAGCDGARSIVRETLRTGFPGGTYRQVFYVADVQAQGPALNHEINVDLDEADFLAVFPLAGEGRARLVGTVRDERAEHAENLRFEDVSGRAIQHLKLKVEQLNWFSTYRVHHRVTEHFRGGRAFVLGDAAHIHSPVGGQGMNTGIGDAVNLAWKLHAVLKGHASDSLLDSYEVERIKFARRLVATTDKVFTLVTSDGRLAEVIRTRVAPLLMPKLVGFEFAREYLFRTVSQITLNYRDSAISEGSTGEVHGGDRLPWVRVGAGGSDNFDALSNPVWQLHVYGSVSPELPAWCAQHNLPLHRFEWSAESETAGLARDGLYLVRPDTYVAFAAKNGGAADIERYLRERELRI
jgi:2-polyprenyl-6-methoxyphenol hydroxylase-like FAD-dependent oxidoreductase